MEIEKEEERKKEIDRRKEKGIEISGWGGARSSGRGLGRAYCLVD